MRFFMFLLFMILFSDSHAASFEVQTAGSGPHMILIPGLSCGADVWAETVSHFSKNYSVHVLTLAGFAGLPADPRETFFDQILEDLVSYIKSEKIERPVVIGHSLGGFLAFALASQEPDLMGKVISVDGLPYLAAVLNPAASEASVRSQAEGFSRMMASLSQEQFEIQNRMALTRMISNTDDLENVARISNLSEPKMVAKAVFEMMVTDLRENVTKIQVPTMLIGAFGQEPDRNQVMLYQEQIKNIPNARLTIAKTKHFVMLDDPAFFQKTVRDFLEK